MLDSIRNSLIGKANYPHQHFMVTGAHAITFVTHGHSSKVTANRQTYLEDFMWLLEKLVRIHD